MEAMSCGLPILASDTKGQTDLLQDVPGALYPAGNIDAFVSAIKQIHESGCYGVGGKSYPTLAQYRLSEVFEENVKLFSASLCGERDTK